MLSNQNVLVLFLLITILFYSLFTADGDRSDAIDKSIGINSSPSPAAAITPADGNCTNNDVDVDADADAAPSEALEEEANAGLNGITSSLNANSLSSSESDNDINMNSADSSSDSCNSNKGKRIYELEESSNTKRSRRLEKNNSNSTSSVTTTAEDPNKSLCPQWDYVTNVVRNGVIQHWWKEELHVPVGFSKWSFSDLLRIIDEVALVKKQFTNTIPLQLIEEQSMTSIRPKLPMNSLVDSFITQYLSCKYFRSAGENRLLLNLMELIFFANAKVAPGFDYALDALALLELGDVSRTFSKNALPNKRRELTALAALLCRDAMWVYGYIEFTGNNIFGKFMDLSNKKLDQLIIHLRENPPTQPLTLRALGNVLGYPSHAPRQSTEVARPPQIVVLPDQSLDTTVTTTTITPIITAPVNDNTLLITAAPAPAPIAADPDTTMPPATNPVDSTSSTRVKKKTNSRSLKDFVVDDIEDDEEYQNDEKASKNDVSLDGIILAQDINDHLDGLQEFIHTSGPLSIEDLEHAIGDEEYFPDEPTLQKLITMFNQDWASLVKIIIGSCILLQNTHSTGSNKQAFLDYIHKFVLHFITSVKDQERVFKNKAKRQQSQRATQREAHRTNSTAAAVDEEDDDDEKEKDSKSICPGCLNKSGHTHWVSCDICAQWWHQICAGLRSAPDGDQKWCCASCTVCPCGERAKQFSDMVQCQGACQGFFHIKDCTYQCGGVEFTPGCDYICKNCQ